MVKVLWIILLPKKLICATCRLVFWCEIFTYLMDCFNTSPEPPETKTLKRKLEHRNLLDKKLQGNGKKFFRSNSDGVRTDVLESFLYQIDQAHQDLINFFKIYLPESVVASIFINEKLGRQLKSLESQNDKLRNEKQQQKEYFENIIARRQRECYEGETKVAQEYSELVAYCNTLEEKIKHFQSQAYVQPINNVSHDNLNSYAKIQRQEEIVKAQSGLISDLKRQSSDQKAKDQKKIQAVRQEFENEIYRLRTTLNQREQQFQQLLQEHQTSQNQVSTFKARFKQDWNNLQQHSTSQAGTIKKLQETLNFTINERKELEDELAKRDLQITRLNHEIFQLRRVVQHHQAKTREEQGNQANVEDQQAAETDYVRESLKKVESVFETSRALEEDVKAFSGTKEDATFLHLQELLIRNVVKLDSVQSDGNFKIRTKRKEVIRYIQGLLKILQEKT